MNDEQLALLDRVNGFKLDAPGASFPFSKKLARENHWPVSYALRVIEEYKRFAFLAVAAGHPVSPSEAIDEAWHMHLTFTQSYWKVFCPEVLGVPFHHNPSQGGKDESAKFDDWYLKTLESYRSFFGSEPPSDIWPSLEDRKSAARQVVRVDKSRHWVIRRPNLAANVKLGLIGILSLFVFGCSDAVAGGNPFDFTGPDFLRFYVYLSTVCILLACWARYALRVPITRSGGPGPHLDGYQLAYLNHGRWLVIDAVIASLVQQKALEFVPGRAHLMPTPIGYSGGHPLEGFVYGLANNPVGISVRNLRLASARQPDFLAEELKREGLLVPDSQASKVVLVPLAIAGIAIIVALMKIFVGLSRERPVAYLEMMTVVTLVVSLLAFAHRPARSRYGDTVLAQIQDQHDHLRHVGHHNFSVPQQDVVMAIGLFGMASLAGSDLGYLSTSLRTPPASSSGCGSSCSGGSTSSCSGGGGGDGGGGGGGCGGGGCGGCGGG